MDGRRYSVKTTHTWYGNHAGVIKRVKDSFIWVIVATGLNKQHLASMWVKRTADLIFSLLTTDVGFGLLLGRIGTKLDNYQIRDFKF